MIKLRQLRKQAGMTLDQFAGSMGVSPVTVVAWESGRRCLKPDPAKRALDVLAEHGVYATLDTLYAREAA